MNRERIIWGTLLFLALASFGGVYQFYFKEKLETYAKHAIVKKNADEAYKKISTAFEGANPDEVIALWSGTVQPWKDSVVERGKFFNDGGWAEHTKPSEDVPILRFWYDKQVRDELTKLYTDLAPIAGFSQMPYESMLKDEFHVQTLADFQNRDVTAQDVNKELAKLAFGMQATRMMIKAKASYLLHVKLWPPRELKDHEGLLRLWTIGLDFGMDMKSLVNFVDSLRTQNRYFNIDGIKIQYPYVGYNVEPVLHVQMLLTASTFNEGKAGTNDDTASGLTGANPNAVVSTLNLRSGTATSKPEEPQGFFGKAYKWFWSLYGF